MGAAERQNPFNQWKRNEAPSTQDAYDRFGRLLTPDDIVYMIAKQDAMWRVVRVRPVLDPKAPPGVVELTLSASVVTGVQGGMPIVDLIKVMDAEETRKFLTPQPTPADPPPPPSGLVQP